MTRTVDFFFYGTLLDAAVRRVVLGAMATAPQLEAATAHGYRCAPVGRGAFPALVKDASAKALGMRVAGVDLTAAARVSLFEGEGYDYETRKLSVETASGEAAAWAYVPTGRMAVEPGEWAIEEWARRHKAAFLANAQRAMRAVDAGAIEKYRQAWTGRLV